MRHRRITKLILWTVALLALPGAYFIVMNEFPSGILAIYSIGLLGLLLAYKRRRPSGEDRNELH